MELDSSVHSSSEVAFYSWEACPDWVKEPQLLHKKEEYLLGLLDLVVFKVLSNAVAFTSFAMVVNHLVSSREFLLAAKVASSKSRADLAIVEVTRVDP
jgi:hypothetical protein